MNRSDASRHAPPAPAAPPSARSQITSRKKIAPTAIAIAPYWVAFAAPKAMSVTRPEEPCWDSSCDTEAPVAEAFP